MKYTNASFGEARLYIGSVKGYKGQPYSEGHLTRIIQDFQKAWQDANDWTVGVRVTKTSFVCCDYQEPGWEIAGVNYPRFPVKPAQLREFFKELRDHLMIELGQNRATISFDFNLGDGDKPKDYAHQSDRDCWIDMAAREEEA